MEIINKFESLNTIIKVVILILLNIVAPVYRILMYLETKQIKTLIGAVLSFIPCVNFVVMVLDVVSELQHNKITFLID